MPKRKTSADYELLAQSFGYQWLGPEVATTNIKTFWLCAKGHRMGKTYSHIRDGRKCSRCAIEASRNTPEDYHNIARLRGFEWLGPEVSGVMIKTWWQCSRDHSWQAKYNHIKNGRGCPHCSHRIPKNEQDYCQLAESRKFQWLGPLPSDTREKTNWRCDLGHEFSTPYTTLRTSKGKGCPHCAGKAHKTIDDYHILAAKYGYQWLGDELPPTVFGKTFWLCDQGHERTANYHAIDTGSGCPHCAGLYPKQPEDYIKLGGERGYKWLGPEVPNVTIKTYWLCKRGHKWHTTYGRIYSGADCFACVSDAKQSKGEKQVAQILDALDILYSRQKAFDGCKDKKALRYDFYFSFSGHQFLIEYNGEQHYKPIERWGGAKGLEDVQRRDRIKAHFAATNGLHLITIPYTDYDRIGTIIIDRLTEATGESPLTFTDQVGAARGPVEMLEGVQLSLGLEN
jgi:hypothetical protein